MTGTTATRMGTGAATMVVVVGIAYALVLAIGMARAGLSEPIVDPILAVMEVLTIASAFPLLAVFAALQACAAPPERPWATLALCFAAMFALATSAVHSVELTVGRAAGTHGLVWPSTAYAIELLAWDLLLGLALLIGSRALAADQAAARVRRWMLVTGVLCVAGIVGPLLGDMRLQLVGVVGYALLLPVTAWMLRDWFRTTG